MDKDQPLVIKDTKDIHNIFVQLNLKRGTTMIYSNFSAWENLSYLLEAVGVTIEQCVSEGIDRKEVHKELSKYMIQIIDAYKIKR